MYNLCKDVANPGNATLYIQWGLAYVPEVSWDINNANGAEQYHIIVQHSNANEWWNDVPGTLICVKQTNEFMVTEKCIILIHNFIVVFEGKIQTILKWNLLPIAYQGILRHIYL